MLISAAAESCVIKTMKGEKPDFVADYRKAKSLIDCIKGASDKLLAATEFASRKEAVKIFDELVALSATVERLRFVALRIRRSAYEKNVDLEVDQNYYKGRFLVTLYDGDEMAYVFQNAREMSNRLGIKLNTVKNALNYVFWGKRSFVTVSRRRYKVFFVSAFD